MNQAIKKIESILKSAYDVDKYTEFVREIFPGVKVIAPHRFIKEDSNFSSYIVGSAHVGTYYDPEGKILLIHAVQLEKKTYVELSRSTQRSYAKKLIENGGADAALVAYYTAGEPRWRLSFVRLDYEIKIENGKLYTSEKMTPAKRYSYLVGEGEPCHTAISRFHRFIVDETNQLQPTLDELEEAFSVEKVTEEFFKLYSEKFQQLMENLDNNEDFVMEASQHNFTSAQFAKKLMGQIVFLYFLQKKGWLGVNAWPESMTETEYRHAFFKLGKLSRERMPLLYTPFGDGTYIRNAAGFDNLSGHDEELLAQCVNGKSWGTGPKDFMRRLFNEAAKKNANFFDDYLEPLFYNALNVNRKNNYYPTLHCRIPFLSGGLFEPIDGYDWEHNDFAIPNEVFSNKKDENDQEGDGILDIFDRYNFTMSEDEPMEREVAIDPEMLGKVFENLLEVKDRKSKGAFYTPREIVHYMCQETLIEYLVKETGMSEQAIRDYILFGDFFKDKDRELVSSKKYSKYMLISDEIYKLNEKGVPIVDRLDDIDNALANIRVADPAVGSGAFPLGMINEIVRARNNISAYKAITTIVTTPNEKVAGYKNMEMYHMERSPYKLKRETIKNCIFGADIDPSAVDIARLRLWLSLVIDDEINPGQGDERYGHNDPIPLPNLECNIICGNSLIDEFEGVPLINNSALIGTDKNEQMDMYQSVYETILPSLLEAQDELFNCKNTDDKKALKDKIDALKDELAKVQMQGAGNDWWDHYKAACSRASKPFVLWQIDFARVFKEKGGFDVVIGNPPYGLLNKKQNKHTSIMATPEELKIYKENEIYRPAKGGMINVFRLFICKSHHLLREKGQLTLIFPMAFMCDLSARDLRKYFLRNATIDYIEAFPERDNENKRVFKSAKMSVCILASSKNKSDDENSFWIRINDDKYVNKEYPQISISAHEISLIDDNSLTIPLVNQQELAILTKICSSSKRLKDFSKCYTGEIDISIDKKYVRLDNSYHRMLRGAQIQRFYITNNISQGEIYYLDDKQYLSEVHTPRSLHHKQRRIGMQGITGVNEKYRLKMTLIDEDVFCANSVNYLLPTENVLYLLGLCNSKLLNWFFKKISTNSNVNGYEIDNLPILIGTNDTVEHVEEIVNDLLNETNEYNTAMSSKQDELDAIVYEIYGLTNDEIDVIEGEYS